MGWRRTKSWWIVLCALALSLAVWAAPDPPSAMRVEVLKAHIDYLASDALAGRDTGEKGNEEAARYIAEVFKKAGLKPLGTAQQNDPQAKMDGSGYFQPFPFPAGVARGSKNSLQVVMDKKTLKYRVGREFEVSGISASGQASAEVVFVGYGIQSREPARDDYASIDVQKRIVLMLAGYPGRDPHSPLAAWTKLRRKALIARDKGALGIIVIPPKEDDALQMTSDGSFSDAGLPIILVQRRVANEWLKAANRSLEEVEKTLEENTLAFPTGVKATLQTEVRKLTKTTANIAGLVEGSDPVLKNEVVIIGAHMDHLGMGGVRSLAEDKKPAIHHGADDNASGTAGVLVLAEHFATTLQRPKRSLLFLCFSGEELGLLGSAYYVKNPLIPLERTVAMLNMDMIGRMRENKLIVGGSGSSPAWPPLIDEANKAANFAITRSDSLFGASDQQSFYMAKIPVLFFFTGLHADYHRPSDTADKINLEDTLRIVEMVALCTGKIADTAARPPYQQIAQAQEGAPRMGFRASLGTIPDYSSEVEGVLLSGVRPGSPAEKAGLKAGDIIVQFGERSIRNIQEYTLALGEHKPGDVVKIVVKRGSETRTLTATLGESRR